MTRKFALRLVATGAVATALGLGPASALADPLVNQPCPFNFQNIPASSLQFQGDNNQAACRSGHENTIDNAALGAQVNGDVLGGSGAGAFAIQSNGQNISATTSAQNDSQNGSFNTTSTGTHAVTVGSTTYQAPGTGGGSYVSPAVRGASNTGGSPQ